MKSEWRLTRLGDHISLKGGLSYKSAFVNKGDALLVGMGCVSHGDRFLVHGGKRYGGEFSESHRLSPGDLVIATRQQSDNLPILGYPAMIPNNLQERDIVVATNLYKITNRSEIDNRFLYWLLRGDAYRERILECSKGTTVRMLTKDAIEDFEFLCPPKAERKAISAFLDALDDKVELNRRMNGTLEAMARALFQSWFVDFDPVRAKLDGHPPAALAPATAALFPNEFEDSELGHIPKGWKVGVLDELSRFVIGGDWGATEPTSNETVSCYCIRGADIPSLQEGGIGKMPIRFLKPSSVEKRQLSEGDLAIEISGGSPTQCTGRPVLVSDGLLRSLGQPLVASNFCRIVKLKSPALSKFVYCWLRGLYDAGSLFQFETGTTGIKNFAFVLFSKKYPLVVPQPRIVEAFDQTVSPLFDSIQANAQQSRTLADIRDALLPKLLTGEVSVKTSAKELGG